MRKPYSFDFTTLLTSYRTGALKPSDVIRDVYERIEERGDDHVWIHLLPRDEVIARARELEKHWENRTGPSRDLPLYGLPFGIKDNIDVAGLPTTAACPAFTYTAEKTATVVQRLLDAGAILVGKTNLDQLANGLVGIRSPYGISRNAIDKKYIPGGSSPGSGVAVAAGLVSFALGTDTGGSGRIPAAYNNVIGLKPTRGLLSTAGLVPVNRGVDCVSVFALTCADAYAVLSAARGYDRADPFSRSEQCDLDPPQPKSFRFGMPSKDELVFFGDSEAEKQFKQAVERLKQIGGTPVEIDFAPFREAGELLFGGPWVAERLVPVKELLQRPDIFYPVTRTIFERAAKLSATETFEGLYKLEQLKMRCRSEWKKMDILVVPTTGTLYTIEELEADPIQRNTNMGYYTYFVNLLVLCAVAVPSGFRSDGMPSSISLIAPALSDGILRKIGASFHREVDARLGGTQFKLP